MGRTISIGAQDFEKIRVNDDFYVDKTDFIRAWWDSRDIVTLITRPRRFGKTLNMSMVECFFSNKYAGREELFEGLSVFRDERYRALQGKYPVIFLSFADIKYRDYDNAKKALNDQIETLYNQYYDLLQDKMYNEADRRRFMSITSEMSESTAARSLKNLCELLYRYYGEKCIVLIDEYDTPVQEAYLGGYWDEITAFIRSLFNSTFKSNPCLERALMTGITRVSKESIFSDLNNLNVVTTTSNEYAVCFGFTEEEVYDAMDEQGIPASEKEKVKLWYDGFIFGSKHDIYNPWSITMYLDKRKYGTYWANTSSNGLIGSLVRQGDLQIKEEFERLLRGECIETEIDEQIVFSDLSRSIEAVWSLFLATGYVKAEDVSIGEDGQIEKYKLSLTNLEVKLMFEKMIRSWFRRDSSFEYFVSAMFAGDVRAMNGYMNRVALATFSSFDIGKKPSDQKEPERFYHGFVLGLLVDKAKTHILKSNRESGYGRYDVVLEPKDASDLAVIMEFKVHDKTDGEASLEDTAASALAQIEEKRYDTDLLERGIPAEWILKYGFAFEGEKCLIRKGDAYKEREEVLP